MINERCKCLFEKSIFQLFANFCVRNLKPFPGKVMESIQSYLNQHLVIGRFLENDFGATLRSKTSVVSAWKDHCSVFLRFLSDKVEIILWEGEAKRSRLFKSKFRYRKLVRKWFWSYLERKNECFERLKRAFFSFLQIFHWRSWNHFLEKLGKVFKAI